MSERSHLRYWLTAAAVNAGGLLGVVALFLWNERSLASASGLAPGGGFPLDDAWIHLQLARNFSLGHGMYFNAGDPVSASSAPLWTLALSILHWLSGEEIVSTVKALGVLLLWGSGMAAFGLALALRLPFGLALLTSLISTITPRLVWGGLSGMEIPLYTLLSTAGIWLHVRSAGGRARPWTTILLAAAALARPECLMLFPLALLDRWRLEGGSVQAFLRRHWRHVLLYAVILAPFLIFNFATLGRPLPNTFYAKVGGYGFVGAALRMDLVQVARTLLYFPLQQAEELIRFSAQNSVLLTCLVPLGIWRLLDSSRQVPQQEPPKPGHKRDESAARSWLIPMVIVAFPLLRGVVAPFQGALFQHGRYAANLVPLLTVVGVLGLWQLLDLLRQRPESGAARRCARWAFPFAWLVLLVNLSVREVEYARTYAGNVSEIDTLHIEMAHWLRENTPADATIATHDIGALGYFARRRLLDTTGIITPCVLEYLRPGVAADSGVLAYLQTARPDYLVILPGWYPRLAERRDLFEPVHEVAIEAHSISAGDRLIAYRTIWASK